MLLGLAPVSPGALTNTWTGTAGKNWFVAGNWSQGHIPVDGEHVVIPNVANDVLLTNSTALLGSFSITNETLTCSNWNTRIIATNVHIRNLGKLALPPPYAEGAMSNRVWVVCTNLVVHPGGQIDADYNGYMVAQGPGKGSQSGSNNNGGGGYGGRGGDEAGGVGGLPYGLTNAPVHPGSGGGRWTSSPLSNGSGGGVVLIGAGNVLVSGTVSARGKSGNNYDGGGSGGSIYLNCQTFGGTGGVLRVDGGEAGPAYGGGGGGGGRIAIIYDSIVGNPTIEFSAVAGNLYTREAAGHGTLYLPDAALVNAATFSTRFRDVRLIIPGFNAWGVESLTLSNRTVSIGEKDFRLTVTNNLLIRNGAKLVLGGIPLSSVAALSADGSQTNPWVRVGNNLTCNGGYLLLGGREQNSYTRLSVGGALTLTNNGQLLVYSGNTNSTYTNGALVTVTGDMEVASGSWFKPIAQGTNGGTPMLMVSNLTLRAGGGIDANSGGYKSLGTAVFGSGKGVSAGSRGGGGGYGGKGGRGENASASGGPAYGVTNAPVLPGSGGAYGYAPQPANAFGGGSIQIWSSVLRLDGTIQANGGNSASTYGGGGSGGGIIITCNDFQGTNTGILRANGGNGGSVGGGGGGGRVAVGIDLSLAQRRQMHRGTAPAGVVTYTNHGVFFGSVYALSGSGGAYAPLPERGTVFYITTNMVLTVMGTSAAYGVPRPQDYGSVGYRGSSTWITNSVATPANEAAGQRWQCTGWTLKRFDGTPVSSGSTTQAIFQLTTNLVLTWKWTNEYYLSVASGPNGTATVSKTGWYTNGVVVSGIGAGADPEYAFSLWSGDVPPANLSDNPLALTMNQTRAVQANFASSAGVDKLWTGAGAWEESARWSPAGMPGPNDRCFLGSGTVRLANPRSVRSLVISNTATLLFTNWTTRLTVRDLTVRNGGNITLPIPTAAGQPTNRIHILCTSNFVVQTGGNITADARGYYLAEGSGKGQQSGSNNNGGGGYGGRGGDENSGMGGPAYGSASAPEQPGSGGGQYLSDSGGNGGGVIRVEATNVVVAGTISANGQGGGNYNGGGSGGSVYITCQTFTGTNGVIRANGGNGGASYGGGGGGGGRVAVVYESLAGTPNVQFSEAAGLLYHYNAPQIGTLYLPDTALLVVNMSQFQNVRLAIPGFNAWTVGSLVVSNASLALADTNFTLNVTGDMMIRNGSWLSVGGVALSAGLALGSSAGDTNGMVRVGGNLLLDNSRLSVSGVGGLSRASLNVGGNLTATNDAQLHVFSGRTNAPGTHGAYVTVTGNVTLTKNSWIYPYSHTTNGASVLFRMNDLFISTNSGFNANGLGYYVEKGPGKGLNNSSSGNSGGGYGGIGGASSSRAGGSVYGSSNAPVHPGSGGGRYDNNGGHGGGLIRIEAQDVTMNGNLLARAATASGQYNGGGSGGGIFVMSGTFVGGASAVMNASGGPRGAGYTSLGSGAGGRIAVWYGTISPGDKASILNGESVPNQFTTNALDTYMGTLSVTGGVGFAVAEPGTALFLTVRRPAGGGVFMFR